MQELPISEARKQLPGLADCPESRVAVTRRGKKVLAILPWDQYESLVETLEILADKDLMNAFHQGIADANAGRTTPLEQIEQDLGL